MYTVEFIGGTQNYQTKELESLPPVLHYYIRDRDDHGFLTEPQEVQRSHFMDYKQETYQRAQHFRKPNTYCYMENEYYRLFNDQQLLKQRNEVLETKFRRLAQALGQ